jgi:hypothetical protein
MKRFQTSTAMAAVFTALFATSAVAAPQFTITRDNGPDSTVQKPIPEGGGDISDNNFHDQLAAPAFGLTDIVFGGLSISLNEDAIATFTFQGKEAGFTNTFTFNDAFGSFSVTQSGDVFDDTPPFGDGSGTISPNDEQVGFDPDTPVETTMNHLTLGPEDFSFTSAGGQNANFGQQGFGIFVPSGILATPTSAPYVTDTLVFGFDDNGNSEDNNHDDLIVSLSVRASPERIPVPASLALLGGGLMGLGVIGRMRRKPVSN